MELFIARSGAADADLVQSTYATILALRRPPAMASPFCKCPLSAVPRGHRHDLAQASPLPRRAPACATTFDMDELKKLSTSYPHLRALQSAKPDRARLQHARSCCRVGVNSASTRSHRGLRRDPLRPGRSRPSPPPFALARSPTSPPHYDAEFTTKSFTLRSFVAR